jgi:hypothetical protein
MEKRGSGILLHITSLPSAFGIGDLGPWAYRFADFLAESKQRYWQCLPLNPTDAQSGNSPYHSTSAFAFNPLLVSPEMLVHEGFLSREDLEPIPPFPVARVDYPAITAHKERLFSRAFERFRAGGPPPLTMPSATETVPGWTLSPFLRPSRHITAERPGTIGLTSTGTRDLRCRGRSRSRYLRTRRK